jgi:hypothetical protein
MSIFVSNLDDFIAPSQACVNPLVSSKLASADKGGAVGVDATAISAPKKKAFVSLSNDYSTSAFTPTFTPKAKAAYIRAYLIHIVSRIGAIGALVSGHHSGHG